MLVLNDNSPKLRRVIARAALIPARRILYRFRRRVAFSGKFTALTGQIFPLNRQI